jgi:catechol 2,3-dioxygenase-like lactoylglutathione lyase family enzyme
MIRGIHHVTVHVRDMERMKRFYKEAFGFEDIGFAGGWSDNPVLDEIIGVEGSAAESVMLCANNCYLELFKFSAPAPGSSRALDPNDHGYTHFCVDVVGIEEEVERLAGIGMTFDRPHGRARAVDVSIVKAIYGRDPEGNLIELQETAPDCPFDASLLPSASLGG